MKLVIGSDHGGYELKEDVKQYLIEKGYDVDDDKCVNHWFCFYLFSCFVGNFFV